MRQLTVGSLFAGIGGFDLGFERAGFRTEWQVEIDPYCRKVLERHFPHAERFTDIRDCGKHNLRAVDVIAGGFPCQPVSLAGKGLAQSDERWLWPEFRRIICEIRPRFVVVENVPGLLSRGMGIVLGDLADIGYDAEWHSLPAAAFGARHLRWRVWIVAYPMCDGHDESATANAAAYHEKRNGASHRKVRKAVSGATQPGCQDDAHINGSGLSLQHEAGDGRPQSSRVFPRSESLGVFAARGAEQWGTEPLLDRVVHGVPERVDRIRGLGNAVVPQIAQWIGERILAAQGRYKTVGE